MRWKRYSAEEEAQGVAFGKLLITLLGGPLLVWLAFEHYDQLMTTGRLVARGKRSVTVFQGQTAWLIIVAEGLVGTILFAAGIWWVRLKLRTFPHW